MQQLISTCDAEKKNGKKRTYSSESATNKSLNKGTKRRKSARKTNSARKDGVSTNTVTHGKTCLYNTNSSANSRTAMHSKHNYTSSESKKRTQLQYHGRIVYFVIDILLPCVYKLTRYECIPTKHGPIPTNMTTMTIPGEQQFVNMHHSPTSFMQKANQSFGIPINMINASTPHTQSTLGSQRDVSNDELLQFINRKFDDITKRLQTLEDLETKVIEVVSKLSRLCVNIAKNYYRW